MNKISATFAVLLLLVSLSQAAWAQSDEDDWHPSCGGPFDKCGFVAKEGGEWQEVIPRQYEAALKFSEGLAGVRVKGRWGFINSRGEVVITPQFDLVGSFAHGLAEVLVGDKVGVVNRQGDLVIEPQFARAIPFTADVVLVKPGPWRSGYFRGYEKLENILEISSFGSGDFGLYSLKSGWFSSPGLITKAEYEFSIFDRTGKNKFIWAKHKDPHSLYGLMRPDGSWQVKPAYDHVQRLCEDRAVVNHNDKWGAVDPEGHLVVPLKFVWLSFWENGFGLTRDPKSPWDNGAARTKTPELIKEGLVDKAGNLVGGRYFDEVGRGLNGIGEVKIDGQWQGIDLKGNIVAHPRENKVYKQCPSGLKVVMVSGQLQLRDENDEPTMPYLQDFYTLIKFDCQAINSIKHNGKWGYVNRAGHLLFDPPDFDNQFDFKDGYAAVQKNKKWGLINEQGQFTVQPTYDDLRQTSKNLFKAKLGDKELWINADGLEQDKPGAPQKEAENRASWLTCPAGVKIIPSKTPGAFWGLADEDHKVIVEPIYRAIHCFQNGVAWVPDESKRQWCPIGSDGQLQDYPDCVTVRYPYIMTHHSPEKLAADPYESSVLWSRALLEYGAGLRDEPPKMIGDGIMSGASSSVLR